MLKLNTLQLGNIIIFLLAITLNGVSNLPSKPFGGQTNADISNAYKTAFTPAGYAFSIWGLIYSLGMAFTIYQSFFSQQLIVNYFSFWFIINFLANGFWLICFTNEWGKMWVSVIVIFMGILFPLLMLYRKLHPTFHPLSPVRYLLSRSAWFKITPTTSLIDQSLSLASSSSTVSTPKSTWAIMFSTSPADNNIHIESLSWAQYICYELFVSVYLGWLCVACIANVSIALTPRNNMDPNFAFLSLNPSDWSIIMQIIATILALVILLLHLDVGVVGPIAWALIAINKQQKSPDYPGNGNVVSISAILGWGLVILGSITLIIRSIAYYKNFSFSTGSNRSSHYLSGKSSDEENKEETITTPLT